MRSNLDDLEGQSFVQETLDLMDRKEGGISTRSIIPAREDILLLATDNV